MLSFVWHTTVLSQNLPVLLSLLEISCSHGQTWGLVSAVKWSFAENRAFAIARSALPFFFIIIIFFFFFFVLLYESLVDFPRLFRKALSGV